MATLVLGAVGTLIGGPIGGAIGATLGNQIDQAVLAPKGRKGPRLGDLTVQTSSYGSPIPKLFGTMRVAGTVIWATDLREDRHGSGSAKSGGKTTTYTYSASFAVALSARPILSVGRIWADGNLLRGADGDWKSETGFCLYLGSEDQAVDPLIAAAEGIAATPAHRGIAYAVFDTLQLADYGNRIPSLTFEVTADAAAVAMPAIAEELSGGAIVGDTIPMLDGFAGSGDSVRGALEALAQAVPMPLADDGTVLRIGDATTIDIPGDALGARVTEATGPRHVRDRRGAATLPDMVTIAHYEPARDYQSGLQSARRDGIGRRSERIDLPAAISAAGAKMLAEDALGRAWIGREQATARVPWRLMSARAGTRATLDGEGPWRITSWTLEHMALELTLAREGFAPPLATADAGRATTAADAVAGATVLALLDLPALDDVLPSTPQIWLAAAGTGAGWRRATVSQSLDGGVSWQVAGQTAPPAIMGSAATALPSGTTILFDAMNSVDIELLNAGMTLQGADDAGLIAGANAASLGGELIQFGRATQLSPTRWRLARLLRGRRGSEAAVGGHAIGERFVLLDPATLLALIVPRAALGTTLAVSALGPGDGVEATASVEVIGQALRPPAPVRLSATRGGDGTVHFNWTRRSRLGWTWLDGGDAPVGEGSEAYRLVITPSAGAARTIETSTPGYDYGPAAQAEDGAGSATHFTAAVVQIGDFGTSPTPATGDWTI